MLVGGADVRLKVQAVGFVELAREAVSREQAHGFHTATYRGFKIRVRLREHFRKFLTYYINSV